MSLRLGCASTPYSSVDPATVVVTFSTPRLVIEERVPSALVMISSWLTVVPKPIV
jgi:hypothetical protein